MSEPLPSLQLALLSPSAGFGGGLERVAEAIQRCWPGDVHREDLYRHTRVTRPSGGTSVKLDFARRVAVLAARQQPAIILVLHVGLMPVGRFAARLARSRLGLFAIGIEVWGPMSAIRKRSIASCDTLLAISSYTAATLASRADVQVEGIHLTPLPVAPAFAREIRSERFGNTSASPPYLLTVSRLVQEHRYKGHFEVAESFIEVTRRVPGARWVVVGDGNDRASLERRCDQLGIGGDVVFEQSVSDDRLIELYRGAAALVLPSVANPDSVPPAGEGFGLVYAEAGALGVPSIASAQAGGAADIVIHGETGLLVGPGDRAALTEAMVRLLIDEPLRERLGTGAQELVALRHTDDAFIRALQEAFA